MSDVTRPAPAFERGDAPARGIVYAMLGLFLAIAVSAVAIAVMLAALTPERQGRAATASSSRVAPEPRLEIDPAANRARLERDAHSLLNSYGWIDRSQDVARIPIGRAMALTAQHGWPNPNGVQKP